MDSYLLTLKRDELKTDNHRGTSVTWIQCPEKSQPEGE